jgi:hypothetical protein
VNVIDIEMGGVLADGKMDLELHAVARNRKVTDRTRRPDAGSSPRAIGRARRKPSLSDGIAGTLTEDGFVHLGRTPFGADAHEVARRHAVGNEILSQMPGGTTPGATTRNPVEGTGTISRLPGDSRKGG